jgi:MarR family transcriptional regulator, transcriptional regulator for hemolysin
MKNKENTEWNPELFATHWINYASRLIQSRFEKCLRPLGFSLPYVGVATELDKSGLLLQRDLASRYGVEQPTMAALLTRMERDGLVSRKVHPEDKRASFVSLTAKGKAKLPEVKQKLVQEAHEVTSGLSKTETRTLLSLLRKVVTDLAEKST